jgi:hypothetical protein
MSAPWIESNVKAPQGANLHRPTAIRSLIRIEIDSQPVIYLAISLAMLFKLIKVNYENFLDDGQLF